MPIATPSLSGILDLIVISDGLIRDRLWPGSGLEIFDFAFLLSFIVSYATSIMKLYVVAKTAD